MEAQRQLQLFKDSDDAFEKRGFANGISMIRDIARTLYDERADLQSIEIANQSNRGALTDDDGREERGPSFAY